MDSIEWKITKTNKFDKTFKALLNKYNNKKNVQKKIIEYFKDIEKNYFKKGKSPIGSHPVQTKPHDEAYEVHIANLGDDMLYFHIDKDNTTFVYLRVGNHSILK